MNAMLLAAGLGTRLRPLTETMPKCMAQVAGRALLERGLDMLAGAGAKRVVINAHYLADMLIAFIEKIRPNYPMEILVSDERDKLLDSAGGIIKALPLLGDEPFLVLNSDSFWAEKPMGKNFRRLAAEFNPEAQDMLLLTLPRDKALLPQRGDFIADKTGRLSRADKAKDNPQAVIYAGGMIVNPAIFKDAEAADERSEASKTGRKEKITPQSLNLYFDRAIAAKRLYGLNLQGQWFSVGSPAELRAAENLLPMSE